MNNKKKIIFAGGGTGGHITPLLSIHTFLSENEQYDFLWLGQRDSLEEKMAKKAGIDFRSISAGKIRRYFDIRNFYEPLKNLTGIVESFYYIIKFKGDIIFSKGGFVSLPVCLAAWILRKKIYIHESDTIMGLSNKICARFATKIFYSFPPEREDARNIYSGHIMNPDMLDVLSANSIEENEYLHVLVIGGSQGSQRIFENVLKIVPHFPDIEFRIIGGTRISQEIQNSFSKHPNVKCYGFISQKELASLYEKSDIAITRGSSVLWELFYFGIHSIIIPLKATGGNHQHHNAEYFQTHFGSDIIDEDDDISMLLSEKMQKYRNLRKKDLNLGGFLDALKKIEENINI